MPFIIPRNKPIKPLPFFIYFGAVFLLAFSGLIVSIYLAVSHYRVYTDIGYKSFCAISKALNCDTVSQSSYAIFLDLPVSVWGIIGYTFFLVLLSFAWSKEVEKKRIWPLLFIISLAYTAYSIILALISTFSIHSYCIMCIVTYGINFLLLFYTWMIRKRFEKIGIISGLKFDIKYLWEIRYKSTLVLSVFLVGVMFTNVVYPDYWHFQMPDISADMPKGITADGHPWIGAEKPELEIIEFADYQCFQCKKMHFFLRQIITDNPDKIRLVHRNYPMDHEFNPTVVPEPFHVGSGKMALIATYAIAKGMFWEVNDKLFTIDKRKGAVNIKKMSEDLGLNYKSVLWAINARVVQDKLAADIREGMLLEITGTPAYVINDEVYFGQIPPEILRKALE